MVAIPFIISRVYAGDALLLANITVVFYFGSLIANFGLLKFMPLSRPGQVYLILQLSRVLVLYLIWYEPSMTWLWIAAAFWGFNMGVTNTKSASAHPDSSLLASAYLVAPPVAFCPVIHQVSLFLNSSHSSGVLSPK
mgnify:CR=1 FL=1